MGWELWIIRGFAVVGGGEENVRILALQVDQQIVVK